MSNFNQGIPGPATLINSSSTLLYGNSASANALSVQQLGAGNVASFRTTTGATALFVGANGNVGIGQTNPAAPLSTVFNTSGIPDTTGSGTSNVAVRFQVGSVALDMGNIVNGNMWLQNHLVTNWATNFKLLLNPNGGYVGIGTTDPSSNLHVVQGATVNFGDGLYTKLNNTGLTAASITGGYNTGTGPTFSGGEYTWTIGGVGGDGGLTATVPFVPGGTYLISWTVRSTSAGVNFQFWNPSFNPLYTSPTLTSSYQTLTFYVTIPSSGVGSSVFEVYGGTGKNIIWNAFSVQRLDTIGTGNVGIGTVSPAELLTVQSGNIYMPSYSRIIMNGGNSNAYLWTNFAKYGDSVTLSYNYYNDGTNRFPSASLGTSRVTCYYNKVEIGATSVAASEATVGVQLTDRATAWTTFSDARMKDVIEPISNAVSKVEQISTVIFKLKNDDKRRVGVLAQDVQTVLPEAVDDTEEMLGVRYTELVPLALAAIKELSAENTALKARLDAIESKLAA